MSSRDFQAFYEAELQTVYRATYLMSGDREVARDATQEAFARALVRWRRLRDVEWAGGWVTTTAMNVARRALRRRPALDVDISAMPVDPDTSLDLRHAIARLPLRQREAVVLFYLLDLPVADVARQMRCAEPTARVHLTRAREALGQHLRGSEIDD